MKRLVLVALIATNVNAHGMYPTGLIKEQYSISALHKVEFSISNQNVSRMCYEVGINDVLLTPYTTCLNPKETKELSVYVSSPPNEWALNEVCTLSPKLGKSKTRSRLCLEVQSYFFLPQ